MANALLAQADGMTATKGTKGAPKPPIINQVSAGGVVYNRLENDVVVAIVSVGDAARWQLPKGLLDKGETPEAAAVRETREEAGIKGEVESLLDTIEYWYVGVHEGRKVRFHKLVHFYLLKYRAGDVSEHDHEVNESRWVPIGEAGDMLAFKSEKRVLELAAAALAGNAGG